MVLISCTTGTVALYNRDEDTYLAIAVEAWDQAGVPYVAGATTLVAAHTLPGFVRLEHAVAEVLRPDRQVREPVRGGPEPRRGAGEAPLEREGARS